MLGFATLNQGTNKGKEVLRPSFMFIFQRNPLGFGEFSIARSGFPANSFQGKKVWCCFHSGRACRQSDTTAERPGGGLEKEVSIDLGQFEGTLFKPSEKATYVFFLFWGGWVFGKQNQIYEHIRKVSCLRIDFNTSKP